MIDKIPLTWWDLYGIFLFQLFIGAIIQAIIVIMFIFLLDFIIYKMN